ncbi:MAG: hypothetical protein K2R98_08840 [Gemmataceae bacterium]|nr:hypothetical protein [Gemmataceae bacterium]
MRQLLMLTLLCGLVSLGCTSSTKKDSKPATTKPGAAPTGSGAAKGTVEFDIAEIAVEGDKETDAVIKIKRTNFDGEVVITAEGEGVTFDPAKPTIKEKEMSTTVKVKSAKGGKVKLTAVGKDVKAEKEVEVKVKEAGKEKEKDPKEKDPKEKDPKEKDPKEKTKE